VQPPYILDPQTTLREKPSVSKAVAKADAQNASEADSGVRQNTGMERSAPENDARERRRFDRHQLTAEVGLRSESNFYTGFSDDISEGGLFVATYALLPIGAKLEVSFWLPNGHEVTCHAEVRWVRDPMRSDLEHHVSPGMGVRFTGLNPDHLKAIREFMAVRPPMFYDGDDE
jgi:uncharacterized protein (TIGR02266 family)